MVEDNAHGAILGMSANIDDRSHENAFLQARHGHKTFAFEIGTGANYVHDRDFLSA
jgi:hypothetical protein